MNKNFQLSVQDILNKQFNVDFKGYSANEVDAFLDDVIADYQAYEEMLKETSQTLQRYEETIEELKNQIAQHEVTTTMREQSTSYISNIDIIKRLSKLEAEVFKNR